jgi:hypothetical protein
MSDRAGKVRRRAARRSSAKANRIPGARVRAIAEVAAESLQGNVSILTRPDRAIRRQYCRGVAARGGDPSRLHFMSVPMPAGDLPAAAVADLRDALAKDAIRLVNVADLRT